MFEKTKIENGVRKKKEWQMNIKARSFKKKKKDICCIYLDMLGNLP